MKAVTYTRTAQFTGIIEKYTGIINAKSKEFNSITIINPIINGTVMRGMFHTNAFDIKEIDINYPVYDSLIGKYINNN